MLCSSMTSRAKRSRRDDGGEAKPRASRSAPLRLPLRCHLAVSLQSYSVTAHVTSTQASLLTHDAKCVSQPRARRGGWQFARLLQRRTNGTSLPLHRASVLQGLPYERLLHRVLASSSSPPSSFFAALTLPLLSLATLPLTHRINHEALPSPRTAGSAPFSRLGHLLHQPSSGYGVGFTAGQNHQ